MQSDDCNPNLQPFLACFTQWVADNVDHNVVTLDGLDKFHEMGLDTFHGMGIIALSTRECYSSSVVRGQVVHREYWNTHGWFRVEWCIGNLLWAQCCNSHAVWKSICTWSKKSFLNRCITWPNANETCLTQPIRTLDSELCIIILASILIPLIFLSSSLVPSYALYMCMPCVCLVLPHHCPIHAPQSIDFRSLFLFLKAGVHAFP